MLDDVRVELDLDKHTRRNEPGHEQRRVRRRHLGEELPVRLYRLLPIRTWGEEHARPDNVADLSAQLLNRIDRGRQRIAGLLVEIIRERSAVLGRRSGPAHADQTTDTHRARITGDVLKPGRTDDAAHATEPNDFRLAEAPQ